MTPRSLLFGGLAVGVLGFLWARRSQQTSPIVHAINLEDLLPELEVVPYPDDCGQEQLLDAVANLLADAVVRGFGQNEVGRGSVPALRPACVPPAYTRGHHEQPQE